MLKYSKYHSFDYVSSMSDMERPEKIAQAWVFMQQGKYQEALDLLEQLLQTTSLSEEEFTLQLLKSQTLRRRDGKSTLQLARGVVQGAKTHLNQWKMDKRQNKEDLRAQILDEVKQISEKEAYQRMYDISHGFVLTFLLHGTGQIPLMVNPDTLTLPESAIEILADRALSTAGLVPNLGNTKHTTFRFQVEGEKCTVFTYVFTIPNSESPDGKDNLILCFVVRPPWSNLELLNLFFKELLGYCQKIHGLVSIKAQEELIFQEMYNARIFHTKTMMAFEKLNIAQTK